MQRPPEGADPRRNGGEDVGVGRTDHPYRRCRTVLLVIGMQNQHEIERQADDLGVEYSAKSGYDSRKMAEFFTTLERLNPGSDMCGLPGWFSTQPHAGLQPGFADRGFQRAERDRLGGGII